MTLQIPIRSFALAKLVSTNHSQLEKKKRELKNGVVREREKDPSSTICSFSLSTCAGGIYSQYLSTPDGSARNASRSLSLFLCPLRGRSAGNRLPCWLKAACPACVLSVKDRRTIRAGGRDRHGDDS